MWSIYCIFPITFAVLCNANGPSLDPSPITLNLVAGNAAVLPCTVKNMDSNTRVMWIGPSGSLLSMNEDVMSPDSRITLNKPYENDWNLRIAQVKYSDRGDYRCQITTTPQQVKIATVNVLVSPVILTEYSSKNMEVAEGSDVELICNATGVPLPEITWYRKHKDTPDVKEDLGTGTKDRLFIPNITREEAGTYECGAHNKVHPPDFHSMKVDVQFAPEIDIGVDTIRQSIGKSTVLDCTITGLPLEVAVWQYNGIDIEEQTWKYEPIVYRRDEISIVLHLEIRELSAGDFGVYTCYASNNIGSAAASKLLEELKITSAMPLRNATTTAPSGITPISQTGSSSTSSETPGASHLTTTTDKGFVVTDINPSDGPGYTVNPPQTEGQNGSPSSCRYEELTVVFAVITAWIFFV